MGSTSTNSNSNQTDPGVSLKAMQETLLAMKRELEQVKAQKAEAEQRYVEGPRAHLFGFIPTYSENAAKLANKAAEQETETGRLVYEGFALLEDLFRDSFWNNKATNKARMETLKAAKQIQQQNPAPNMGIPVPGNQDQLGQALQAIAAMVSQRSN